MRLLMTRSVSGGRRVRLVIFSVTDTVVLPDSKSMSLAFFLKRLQTYRVIGTRAYDIYRVGQKISS